MEIVVRQLGNAMSLVPSELTQATAPSDMLITSGIVAAMAVSFGTMDWISGDVIAALVLLNVSVGACTEWQAEQVSLTGPLW
jgi:Na+-exporting ATPase